jgi:hypothetical protein
VAEQSARSGQLWPRSGQGVAEKWPKNDRGVTNKYPMNE